MLLSELILSKRGPLAKVWLSAHHERKLSKQQALGVDVEESVDAILQDTEPMALRVSGQLMLGVVRIYGRKVQYLMDDCKDMRERVTLAFRPGMVDLPEDQARASKNAITFEAINGDAMDIFDWSFVPDIAPARGLHTAPLTQTNLRSREYGAFNFGRPQAPSIFGDSSSRQGSEARDETSHLDSQDFQPMDLGLGLDDYDASMEIGREAQRERSRSAVRDPSLMRDEPMQVDAFDDSFQPMDLGLDNLPPLEPDMGDERRRQTSELSTPPPEESTVDVTPRTAKRIADAKDLGGRTKRARVVRADHHLELPDEAFNDPPTLTVARFIPANPEAVRLREIIDDPISYFIPTLKGDDGEEKIFAGPPGLAPELAELFAFPTNVLRRHREESAQADEQRTPKRARVGTVEEEMEEARRQSRLPSELNFDGGMDAFPDLTFDNLSTPPPFAREPSIAPSRAESIARQVQYADTVDHPLSMFDTRTRNARGELESMASELGTPRKSQTSQEDEAGAGAGGFSKATGMAMGVLRREIEAIEGEMETEKKVSFNTIAKGASKRAASAFFFELLVLGTRDAVALEQKTAFGPIEVRGKEKLWEGASVAAA